MSEHPPNTAAMVRQRKKDSKNKRGAVLATVEAMERTRSPITVAEVARRAGVSPWLVRQEPLLGEVRKAQARHSIGAPTSQEPARSSTGALHVERDLLRQENQRLRHELQRHQRRISELLGDQIDGTDAHSQSLRVEELTDQNAALSRQASEATQQVHKLQQQLAALSTDVEAAQSVNRSLMAELNRPGRVRAP